MLNGCLGRRIKINSRRIENCIIQELPREKIKNFMQYTKSNLVVLNTDVFTIVLVVKLNWNNIGLLQYIQIKSRRFSVPENKLKVFSNLTTFLKECEKCAKTISTPPPQLLALAQCPATYLALAYKPHQFYSTCYQCHLPQPPSTFQLPLQFRLNSLPPSHCPCNLDNTPFHLLTAPVI